MKILITGIAGFIGFHTAKKCIDSKNCVVGIDNLNNYYDTDLKKARLFELGLLPKDSISNKSKNLSFLKLDISNQKDISKLFQNQNFDCVIHLAAQVGVRYSIENPHIYLKSNLDGFLNILEGCRHNKVKHLIYASSSSVYGNNTKVPFNEEDSVDHPISLYAATKRSNELMAYAYSHLYGLPTTGLRFFTVYGLWGRPDMAPFLFTKAIFEETPIKLFNNGQMQRDFTFIDDIVEPIIRLLKIPPSSSFSKEKPNISTSPFRLYNIGNSNPVHLNDFISSIEKCSGKKALKEFLPMQAGDVSRTFADIEDLSEKINFRPNTSLNEGIKHFVEWYKAYYKVKSRKLRNEIIPII